MATSFSELRTELLTNLTAELGDGWYISRDVPLDVISKPTVYLVRDSIGKGSTQGFLSNTFSIYLAWPQDTSEDRIDEDVETAIQALDSLVQSGTWTGANRILFADLAPGWQFEFSALSTRTPDNPPIE